MLSTMTLLFELTKIVCRDPIASVRKDVSAVREKARAAWPTHSALEPTCTMLGDKLSELDRLQTGLDGCNDVDALNAWLAVVPDWLAGAIKESLMGCAASLADVRAERRQMEDIAGKVLQEIRQAGATLSGPRHD